MITSAKVVYLVVMLCSGQGEVTECPDSYEPKSWTGPEATFECQQFITSKEFDPSDYVMLGAHEFYAVRCQ